MIIIELQCRNTSREATTMGSSLQIYGCCGDRKILEWRPGVYFVEKQKLGNVNQGNCEQTQFGINKS